MNRKLFALAALILCLVLLAPLSSFAHHGGAAYDMAKITTIKGTITDFEFINPHVEVYFDVKDDKGNTEKWNGEASNTLALHRHGWTSKSLSVGQTASFSGNRAKNGTNVMRLQKIVLEDGTELNPFPTND